MISHPALKAGTRVRLRSVSHVLTLSDLPGGDLGRIVRPDELDYYLVKLDRPAWYRRPDGAQELLSEILEDIDNLEVIDPHPGWKWTGSSPPPR
jgi:hypothetical protein